MQAEAETVEALKDVKVSPRTPSKPDDMKKRGRKISAKCWMATKFPMSLRQLLPVMDVIGHANKHLAKVTKFLRKYGDMELFPVRFQVTYTLCYTSVRGLTMAFSIYSCNRAEDECEGPNWTILC